MKNVAQFICLNAALFFMISCCPEKKIVQNYESCVNACNAKEDAVISRYEHCLSVAAEIRQNKLTGTPEMPGCFSMSGDAKANCIQMANAEYQEAVRRCKETFNQEYLEARKCIIQCVKTDINTSTN